MKDFLQKISPEWPLRIGLGLMYIYSGVDILRHPSAWLWAVRLLPDWLEVIPKLIGPERFLFLQGLGEIFLAFLLLAWFLPRKFLFAGAVITTLEMAGILLFVGLDAVTFRDIGLLGASVALVLMSSDAVIQREQR